MPMTFKLPNKAKEVSWVDFKRVIRKVDRDSLLEQCAIASSLIAQDRAPERWTVEGVTQWNIADVARTALAWGQFNRPKADLDTLRRLCNLNVQIVDERGSSDVDPGDRVSRMLTRSLFEQFPGQSLPMVEVARSLLLFGDVAEKYDNFKPRVMKAGWFELATNGLSLHEYVESVVMSHLLATAGQGRISLDLLGSPEIREILGETPSQVVRRTLDEQMTTTLDEFKTINREFQGRKPDSMKKFAFNYLTAKPFVSGVGPSPIAPSMQNVISKAFPPAIYHIGLERYDEAFSEDLGRVFEEYTGHQLAQIEGESAAVPEVTYRLGRNKVASCDWILDLPNLQVLIECKARQPIESLRVRDESWLNPIEGSINRGIGQLNRSHENIEKIALASNFVDPLKQRIGLVVTLEPFYVSQNWKVWDHLQTSTLPVGVISVSELESLVLLNADDLSESLRLAVETSVEDTGRTGLLLMNNPIDAARGRENPLLRAARESLSILAGE